jgi:hypothetical protein
MNRVLQLLLLLTLAISSTTASPGKTLRQFKARGLSDAPPLR